MKQCLSGVLLLASSLCLAAPVWEKLDTNIKSERMERIAVPHGWLVRNVIHNLGSYDAADQVTTSMVFIPDETHEWKIN